MLHSILDLEDVDVGAVMTHRKTMEMIDAGAAPADILEQVVRSPHTRLPVWNGEPDNIVGVLHAKDLLRAVHANLGRSRPTRHSVDRRRALVRAGDGRRSTSSCTPSASGRLISPSSSTSTAR